MFHLKKYIFQVEILCPDCCCICCHSCMDASTQV